MIVAGAGFGALLGAPTRYIVTNETPAGARATADRLLSQALIVGQTSAARSRAGSRRSDERACGLSPRLSRLLRRGVRRARARRNAQAAARRARPSPHGSSGARALRRTLPVCRPTRWRISRRRSRITTLHPATGALLDATRTYAGDAAVAELLSLGELAGRAETIALGFDANERPPELHKHDRFGHRSMR